MNQSRPNRVPRARYLLAGAAALAFALLAPAAASAKDRNHDRIPDRWERAHGLSLKVNQARRDQDRDSLVNRREWKAAMDPRDADSDGDGIEDGDESSGKISSYDPETGLLTIDAAGSGPVTGLVTDATEIKCDDGDDNGDEDGDGHGGDDDGTTDQGHGDRLARSDGDDDPVGDDSDDPADDDSSEDPADDDSSDDDGEDDETLCTTADLVPGAAVHEADLEIEGGGATWEEIELLK